MAKSCPPELAVSRHAEDSGFVHFRFGQMILGLVDVQPIVREFVADASLVFHRNTFSHRFNILRNAFLPSGGNMVMCMLKYALALGTAHARHSFSSNTSLSDLLGSLWDNLSNSCSASATLTALVFLGITIESLGEIDCLVDPAEI